MSAAEKLRALEGNQPAPWRFKTRPVPNRNEASISDETGWHIANHLHDEDAQLIVALRNALPQIVAVVEAAEGTDPNQRWLHRALAALDEALTPAGGNG